MQIRAESTAIAAAEARRLRLLAQFSEGVSGDAAALLSMEGRGPTAPEELVRSAVIGEIQAVLGVPAFPAERSMDLARRLHTVLPETLDALQAGRLDLVRARELSEATEVLSADAARRVQDQLLGAAGDAPWAGVSPRAWKARIARAVVRADVEGARERREQEYAKRLVCARATEFGMGELLVTADARRGGDGPPGADRPRAAPTCQRAGWRPGDDGPAPGRCVLRGVPPHPRRPTPTRGARAPGT